MTLDQALDSLEIGEALEYGYDLAVCTLTDMEALIKQIYAEHDKQLCITCEYKIVDNFYNLHRCKKVKMIDTYDKTFGCSKWRSK